MDLGVYGISLAVELIGAATSVKASSRLTATSVDAQTSVLLEFEGGRQALIHASIDLPGPQTTSIIGTDGRIDVAESWFMPSDFPVTTREGKRLEPHQQEPTYGLQYEAAELERLAHHGLLESPIMPHDQTRQVLSINECRPAAGRHPIPGSARRADVTAANETKGQRIIER
jgi:predicted dehydrogenase